jgi:hypothetical protein
MKAQTGNWGSCTRSLNSALDEGGWSTPRPGCFTPRKDPIPIVQNIGWARAKCPEGRGKCRLIGIRSPEPPVRRESLYRLSSRGLTDFDGKFHNQLEATTETSMLYLYFLMHTHTHTHTHMPCRKILFGSTLRITQIPNPWSVGFWLHWNGIPSEKY